MSVRRYNKYIILSNFLLLQIVSRMAVLKMMHRKCHICGARVKKMRNHFIKVHDMKPGSQKMRSALRRTHKKNDKKVDVV